VAGHLGTSSEQSEHCVRNATKHVSDLHTILAQVALLQSLMLSRSANAAHDELTADMYWIERKAELEPKAQWII